MAGNGSLPMVSLAGVELAAATEPGCIGYVMDELESGRGGWIITVNLDILRRLVKDEGFAELVRDAELKVPDGMPLLWAARLQGTPMPERVAGSNLVTSLSAAAGERGRSVFLLGGDPGTAEAAAEALKLKIPSLRIAGTYCPPFGFEKDAQEFARLTSALVDARSDIVYVALGCPKQEQLIRRLRERLPGAWWIGVGISFSFLSGRVRRAPKWMQKVGLEWLHRLCQEPRRLARRYLVDDLPFAAGLLARCALSRRKARR